MVTPDLSRATWRKSRRSNASGCCVEVAATGRAVAIRDSKAPTGPVIALPAREWHAFTWRLKAGTFDA
jgi:hypothetical protein